MHQIVIGNWALNIEAGSLPLAYDWYVGHALLADEIDLKARRGYPLFVGVHAFDHAQHEPWKPILTVAQTYERPSERSFDPGLLLVPETARLFIGAGTRVLGYDLTTPARLWEDQVDCGFWKWGRHGNFVWMEAELEFAVWSTTGRKLWTTSVEPPWSPAVADGKVELDIMGLKQTRRMSDGQILA